MRFGEIPPIRRLYLSSTRTNDRIAHTQPLPLNRRKSSAATAAGDANQQQLEDGDEDEVCDGGERVVRARGLPWQASEQDIADFFVGLNIAR